jgi:hypothetical protein
VLVVAAIYWLVPSAVGKTPRQLGWARTALFTIGVFLGVPGASVPVMGVIVSMPGGQYPLDVVACLLAVAAAAVTWILALHRAASR